MTEKISPDYYQPIRAAKSSPSVVAGNPAFLALLVVGVVCVVVGVILVFVATDSRDAVGLQVGIALLTLGGVSLLAALHAAATARAVASALGGSERRPTE